MHSIAAGQGNRSGAVILSGMGALCGSIPPGTGSGDSGGRASDSAAATGVTGWPAATEERSMTPAKVLFMRATQNADSSKVAPGSRIFQELEFMAYQFAQGAILYGF
jgi:hypothetical protein